MKKLTLLAAYILLVYTAAAQYPSAEYAIKEAGWRIDALTKLFLCAAWGIVAGVLSLVVIVSGVRYLAEKDLEDRVRARKTVINAFIGLLVIAAACPFVNYLVHGTDVAEFKCDCIPLPPPTTTTTTTTTIPIMIPGTRVSTTTTVTTTTTTTTTWPKTGGGRFLLVGNMKYDEWVAYVFEDLYGVIFNMDGSTYKQPFYIDNDRGPVALAVGNNRFFVAYGSNAVVLDWEGNTVKAKFQTKSGYLPVKAVQTNGLFYVLLTPAEGSGGCYINVYGLDGALQKEYETEIGRIDALRTPTHWVPGGVIITPDGDMALGGGKLFIVWSDTDSEKVNAIAYDLSGKKVKDRFTMAVPQEPITGPNLFSSCSLSYIYNATDPSGASYISLIKPQTEAGSSNFIVMANRGKMFLYDINTLQLKGEKSYEFFSSTTYASVGKCIHDIAYGDGKFLAVYFNYAIFFDENGNQVGAGEFGGHGDCPTHLAYGNKMFVGVVAIHLGAGDGIGASFLDSTGKHIIDTLPIEMAESPGWAAYDW